MANLQLADYIRRSLEVGRTEQEITNTLIPQGWQSDDIKNAFVFAEDSRKRKAATLTHIPTPPKSSEWGLEFGRLSAAQILLYLGGLIVVLAGVIYVGINWSTWDPMARVFAIFLPMIITYGTGAVLFGNSWKKEGVVFLVVGAFIFPLFLGVMFHEFQWLDTSSEDTLGLTIAVLSFILYFVSDRLFKLPLWSLLYHFSALLAYYFFLKVIGVPDSYQDAWISWLLLIPGTLYLLLSPLYDSWGNKEVADYTMALGGVTVVLSFFQIFADSYSHDYVAWLLALLGVLYFSLGLFYETAKKRNHGALYLIGVGMVFLSLFSLGSRGTILESLYGEVTRENYRLATGWSNFIVGLIYLFISRILSLLRPKEAASFGVFFEGAGALWVLGSTFYLGLGGLEPFYETLLLILSLGFIFTSIPKQAQSFLYFGTFFLVIYIFSIGGEYFENNVGWPLTLFVAGLASMGIGISIEKIRKKYFTTPVV